MNRKGHKDLAEKTAGISFFEVFVAFVVQLSLPPYPAPEGEGFDHPRRGHYSNRISRRAWASRSAASACSGVSALLNRKPR